MDKGTLNKTLLVLGAGHMQIPAIQTARDLGLQVIAIDPNPDAPGFEIANEKHVLDLGCKKECLEIGKQAKIDGVITLAAEYPIPTVAFIADSLDLNGISPETALQATDKQLMRKAFYQHSVPSPLSIAVQSASDAVIKRKKLDGPIIVKPVKSSGSRGVTLIPENSTDKEVESAYSRACGCSRSPGVLLEEFIEGPEFSIEAITVNGETHVVAVTDKLTSGPPYFVEVGHSQPSRLSEQELSEIVAVARNGIDALGIDSSPSHSELRLSADGPKIIEIGARLGGGYITTRLVPLAQGIDLVRASILLALGLEIDLQPRYHKSAAIRFLEAKPGIVAELVGVKDAERIPGIQEVKLNISLDDEVLPLRDASARIGYVISQSEERGEAISLAERAKSKIKIVTRTA